MRKSSSPLSRYRKYRSSRRITSLISGDARALFEAIRGGAGGGGGE